MNNQFTFKSHKAFSHFSFWIMTIALLSGAILSLLSLLEVCVEHCSANRDYHLFGMSFAWFGILFFSLLLLLNFCLFHSRYFSIMGYLLTTAVGAELFFLFIQKYQTEQFCPLCLSIGACVAVATGAYFSPSFSQFISTIRKSSPLEAFIKQMRKASIHLSWIVLGFILAFLGVSHPSTSSQEETGIDEIKSRLNYGNKNSPIEIYLFTDWFCPACKKVELTIEFLLPKVRNQAQFYFIDYPIHTKSLNFSPYNLSVLINNRDQYLKARHALLELTEKTEDPTNQDVVAIFNPLHISYTELSYLDVKAGIDFFQKIADQFNVEETPTLVINNRITKQSIKLSGTTEITKKTVLQDIDKLKTSH